MKKSLTRVLTMALVLAMLISVVPFALAAPGDETMSLTLTATDTTLVLGGKDTTTVTFTTPEGYELIDADWNGNDYVNVIGSGDTAMVQATSAGKGVVSVNAVLRLAGEDTIAYATGAVEITVENAAPTGVKISGAPEDGKLTVGQFVQLTAKVTPNEASQTVTWTSSDETKATVSETGLVKAVAAGNVTITATASKGSEVQADSVTLTVENSAFHVALDKAGPITLVLNSDEATTTVKATVLDKDRNPVDPQPTITWTSSNTSYVTVTGGVITAKKATGETPVTVTASYTAEDGAKYAAEITVIVTDNVAKIDCDDVSTTNATYTLEPDIVPVNETETYTNKSFTYTVDGTPTAANILTGNLTLSRGTKYGLREVVITGTAKDSHGNTVTATKTVYVSFAGDYDLTVYMKDNKSSFTFTETDVFSKTSENYVTSMYMLLQTVAQNFGANTTTHSPDLYTFTPDGNLLAPGTLQRKAGMGSLTKVLYTNLGEVTFTTKASSINEYDMPYRVEDTNGRLIVSGVVTIVVSGIGGDVEYSTDYKTPVTFNEEDFVNFWYDTYKNYNVSYVTFKPTSSNWGTLYTTSSKTTKVTSTMQFKPYYTTSTTYYDLDTVTYVPYASKTDIYTDAITFTVTGTVNGVTKELTGTVLITLNDFDGNITSRGVVFGSGITAQMAANYKTAKDAELSYVTFYLPDVEDGRLYYNYSGIMDSARVDKVSKYYVTPTTSQLALDKVAFVPAAGTTGKVTIFYTGYDSTGKITYEGSIVLNVTAKTKSDKFTDVTASSYSWAADSIDFLYYEEVVNGTSDTKYSPSGNITRGDFMLMLYRAFLADDYSNFTVTSNFADVTKGTTTYSKETYQAVGVAKYLGIAKGDGTNFNPKSSITREEAMTLLYRTLETLKVDLEYTSGKTTSSFTDYSKVSSYAQEAISYLIKHGIVIGSNGQISPKSNITRAEMAVILHRVLTY